MGNWKKAYKAFREARRQLKANAPYQIRFYNFWDQNIPDMWLYRFIDRRGLLKGKDKRICFFSTFGGREMLKRAKGDVNVFFTGENVQCRELQLGYTDHFLNEKAIDFAMGFDDLEDPRYLRFPLWLMYMFEPESNEDVLRKRCAELRFPQGGRHHKFASLISRGDVFGVRTEIYKAMSKIDKVDCAGAFMHNCDDLWEVFADDKKRFISEYKFNICPENSNRVGYVTEKVFEAIDAGCVPVYWGSSNKPEPDVVNPDAVVFWDRGGDNAKALGLIDELNRSQTIYEDFAHQSRLTENAEEFVIGKFRDLENRISALV